MATLSPICEEGVDLLEFKVQQAVSAEKTNLLIELLNRLDSPDCPTLGRPPLHTAISTLHSPQVSRERVERMIIIITLLLEKGAGPNSEAMGVRPLHLAVKIPVVTTAERVVRMLLQYGADPSLTNARGQKPEAIAQSDGVRILLLKNELVMCQAECSLLRQTGTVKTSRFCVIV